MDLPISDKIGQSIIMGGFKSYEFGKEVINNYYQKVVVKAELKHDKELNLSVTTNGKSITKVVKFPNFTMFYISNVYKIQVEERTFLINLRFSMEDEKLKHMDNIHTLSSLQFKANHKNVEDLINYIEYMDFNYILNIILGAYTLHMYSLRNPLDYNYDKLIKVFISKLDDIGFFIEKPTKKITKKINELIENINFNIRLSPIDTAFLLINTLPKDYLDNGGPVKDADELTRVIYEVLEDNNDIDVL